MPIATSDLEEFVSAYLRDAPFAETRFGQRVAQALGRCNRGEHDRAVYLLADPEFLGRFSQQRLLDALPDDVRGDVFAALERSDAASQLGSPTPSVSSRASRRRACNRRADARWRRRYPTARRGGRDARTMARGLRPCRATLRSGRPGVG